MKPRLQQKQDMTQKAPPLTPRQKQILHLITDGYTSREIGEQLRSAPRPSKSIAII